MIGKMKNAATVIYRVLGFVYALAGLVGCVLLLVLKNGLSSGEQLIVQLIDSLINHITCLVYRPRNT